MCVTFSHEINISVLFKCVIDTLDYADIILCDTQKHCIADLIVQIVSPDSCHLHSWLAVVCGGAHKAR